MVVVAVVVNAAVADDGGRYVEVVLEDGQEGVALVLAAVAVGVDEEENFDMFVVAG